MAQGFILLCYILNQDPKFVRNWVIGYPSVLPPCFHYPRLSPPLYCHIRQGFSPYICPLRDGVWHRGRVVVALWWALNAQNRMFGQGVMFGMAISLLTVSRWYPVFRPSKLSFLFLIPFAYFCCEFVGRQYPAHSQMVLFLVIDDASARAGDAFCWRWIDFLLASKVGFSFWFDISVADGLWGSSSTTNVRSLSTSPSPSLPQNFLFVTLAYIHTACPSSLATLERTLDEFGIDMTLPSGEKHRDILYLTPAIAPISFLAPDMPV